MFKYVLITFLVLSGISAAHAGGQSFPNDNKNYEIKYNGRGFEPFELIVPANQIITITVTNDDITPIEFNSYQLRRAKIIQPGRQEIFNFNELLPGTYKYNDEFHDDKNGFITAQ